MVLVLGVVVVGLVCYVAWSGFRVLLFCCDVVSCLEVSVG